MRVKSKNNGRAPALRCFCPKCSENGSVSEVDSIEVSDRQRTATQMIRKSIELTKNFHVDRFGRGGVWEVGFIIDSLKQWCKRIEWP